MQWIVTPQDVIAEGIYVVECTGARGPRRLGSAYKFELIFTVTDGQYPSVDAALESLHGPDGHLRLGPCGTELSAYYNVTRVGDDYSFGRRGKLRRDAELAAGGSLDGIGRKGPAELFVGKLFIARVETVTLDWQRNPLPADRRYSTVRELLRLVPSGTGDEDQVPF